MKRLVSVVLGFLVITLLPGVWVVQYIAGNSDKGFHPGLVGCLEDGPCLVPPAGGLIRLPDVGQHTLCIEGSDLGQSGQFLMGTKTLPAHTWNDTEACVELEPRNVHGQRIAIVREDGVRSNSVPVIGPVVVDGWEIPERVYPGTSMFVQGKNLEHSTVLGTGVTMIRVDDDRLEFFISRPGTYDLRVSDVQGPTVVVQPELVQSCRVGPTTPCTLVINRVGERSNVQSVEVGGLPAEVTFARGAHLEFEWPEGLTPGRHQARVILTDGVIEADVEMLGHDVRKISTFSLTAEFVRRRAYRPPAFDGFIVHPGFFYGQTGQGPMFGTNFLYRVPLDETTGEPGSVVLGQGVDTRFNPYLLARGDNLLVMNLPQVSGSAEFQVGVEGEDWTCTGCPEGPDNASIATFTKDRIAAVRFFGEQRVEIHGKAFDRQGTQAVVVQGATVREDLQTRLSQGIYQDSSVAWLSDDHLFLSTCGESAAPAGLMRIPILIEGEDEAMEISLGDEVELIDGTDPERSMLGCHGRDEGFYWVERVDGEDRLYFAGANDEVQQLATLPAEQPGVGERFDDGQLIETERTWTSGLLTMQILDNGDAYFLLARRDDPIPTVQLLRWTRSTGAFGAGEAALVQMNGVLGDSCVGPWNDTTTCAEIGQFGCGMLACDQGRDLQTSAWVRPRAAELFVPEEQNEWAHVFVVMQRTYVPEHALWNNYEFQHIRVPRP